MNDLLARLLAEADRALPIRLDDASDDEVRGALTDLADHPLAPDVFVGLCRSKAERSLRAAVHLVALTPDPAVMAEVVRSVANGLPLPDRATENLHEAMILRASDRHAHWGLRSQALLGALQLSQSDPSRMFGLLAFLVRLTADDHADFLKHAVKIIGLVQAHRPEPELEAILTRIADSGRARDEAAMELGLIELRRGLEQRERSAALAAFSKARGWFDEAVASAEARPDAELYRRSVAMLLEFQQGRRSAPGGDEVAAIREAAFEYAAFAAPADRRLDGSWLVDRVNEAMGWFTLGISLARLEESFDDDVWLEAATVIERQLLVCYSASRSTLRMGADGGLEEIIRPAIVDALQREQTKLQMLERWIERNALSDMILDARALQQSVLGAREASVLRNPTKAAIPAGVAAVLDSRFVTAAGQASALREIAADMATIFLATIPPVVAKQFQTMRNTLSSNPDYAANADAGRLFDVILLRTLAFQYEVENIEPGARPWSDYLFNVSEGEPPDEADLHEDYLATMRAATAGGGIRAEGRGIGHGRADVVFDLGLISVVAEIKKTHENRTLQQLLDEHGLQAVSYQRTNVRLALLVVLDLFDRGGTGDHFEASSAVLEKVPSFTTTPYSVAVFRIQGRKRTPSKVRARLSSRRPAAQ